MNATALNSTSEQIEAVGASAALQDVAAREQAAERLVREMDRAARLYERMGRQLGRALDSDRTRRQHAWNRSARQRLQPSAD